MKRKEEIFKKNPFRIPRANNTTKSSLGKN